LVTQLLTAADAAGVAATYLLTTTADQWFPRFGYRAVQRADVPTAVQATEEFRALCPASAVVMRRARGGVG
jgi:amino-acid N-acetyltransferase